MTKHKTNFRASTEVVEKQRAYQRLYWATHPEQRERNRQRALNTSWRNRSLIATWKLSEGCKDCGLQPWDCPEVLESDHIRGIKEAELSSMMTFSIERIVAELEKCETVCANCHRKRTAQRRK